MRRHPWLISLLLGCGGAAKLSPTPRPNPAPVAKASISDSELRNRMLDSIALRGVERVWGTARVKNDHCPPLLAGAYVAFPAGVETVHEDGKDSDSDSLEVRLRDDGRVVWSMPTGSGWTCPVIWNNSIAFTRTVVESPYGADAQGNSTYRERRSLVVAELKSGRIRCEIPQQESVVSLSAVGDTLAIAAASDAKGEAGSGHLTAIAADCKELWVQASRNQRNLVQSASNGFLVYEQVWKPNSSRLDLLDAHSGATLWTLPLGTSGFALGAAEDSGNLVVHATCDQLGFKEHCLYVVDSATGVTSVTHPVMHLPTDAAYQLPHMSMYWARDNSDGESVVLAPLLNRRGLAKNEPGIGGWMHDFAYPGYPHDWAKGAAATAIGYPFAFDTDGFFSSAGRFAANQSITIEPTSVAGAASLEVAVRANSAEFGASLLLLDRSNKPVCAGEFPPRKINTNQPTRISFVSKSELAANVGAWPSGRGVCETLPLDKAQAPYRWLLRNADTGDRRSSPNLWYGTAKSAEFGVKEK